MLGPHENRFETSNSDCYHFSQVMSMMSPGFFVIFLLLSCDSLGQKVNEEDWLKTCCKTEPIQQNRTLVTLGYLPAVGGFLRNR